jgi:hypothetical protein
MPRPHERDEGCRRASTRFAHNVPFVVDQAM